MKSFLLASSLLLETAFGACHTGVFQFDEPWLGITTKDVKNAGMDSGTLYARVMAANSWSDWRRLDTSNCNDFVRGATDYFDDFDDITTSWQALALFNCGTDGIGIDAIYYYDGNSVVDNKIDSWCGSAAGLGAYCYYGGEMPSDSTQRCYVGYDEAVYDYLWLDKGNKMCTGVSLDLSATLVDGVTPVGKAFLDSFAGIPDCSGEYGAHSVGMDLIDTSSNGTIAGINASNLVLYLILALIVLNFVLISYMFCQRYCPNKKVVRYKAVHMDSQTDLE